jgi:hypothetical protein
VSNFNGSHGKGYMRVVREEKRKEAEERQVRDFSHSRRRRHRVAIEKLGECPDCEGS